MGGFSLWHWLIVLVIVVLVFGTKRLKNVGQDLGEAVKGFKKGIHDDDKSGDDGKSAAQLPDTREATAPPPAGSPPASTDGTASGDSDTSTNHTRTPR